MLIMIVVQIELFSSSASTKAMIAERLRLQVHDHCMQHTCTLHFLRGKYAQACVMYASYVRRVTIV